jgi:hypothetical protein
VFAFDFTFGLGRGGVAQANVVELERPTQLRQGVGIVGEEEAVVINIELQGSAVVPKSRREEGEVGEEEFALVELGAREDPAAIIQHVQHRKGVWRVGQPAMG